MLQSKRGLSWISKPCGFTWAHIMLMTTHILGMRQKWDQLLNKKHIHQITSVCVLQFRTSKPASTAIPYSQGWIAQPGTFDGIQLLLATLIDRDQFFYS